MLTAVLIDSFPRVPDVDLELSGFQEHYNSTHVVNVAMDASNVAHSLVLWDTANLTGRVHCEKKSVILYMHMYMLLIIHVHVHLIQGALTCRALTTTTH